jgi:hypothetical protein
VFQHVAISRHIGPDERGTAFGIIGVEKVYVAGERDGERLRSARII